MPGNPHTKRPLEVDAFPVGWGQRDAGLVQIRLAGLSKKLLHPGLGLCHYFYVIILNR